MRIKFIMLGGWTVEVHTQMRKNAVVGTTTGYGLRVKLPKETGLGWKSVESVELYAETEDIIDGNCGLRDCVSIHRGKGTKGRPCAVPMVGSVDRGTKSYLVFVPDSEIERIWKIRNQWDRFRDMMRGPELRSVRVSKMRKKAKRKRMVRDMMAFKAFLRYANAPDTNRMKIVDLMYKVI